MAADGTKMTAELLVSEIQTLAGDVKKSQDALADQYKALHANFDGVKASSDEVKGTVAKHAADYAQLAANTQALQAGLDHLKRQIDQPVYKGGSDLADTDRKNAIELQRRLHIFRHGNDDGFKPDMQNLAKMGDVRSAAQKLMKGGLLTKSQIVASFSAEEKHAFEASGLDSAFFTPELLGYVQDCTIVCAEMLDLYGQISVSKSTFMYPAITSYGDIGAYGCDASCDAPLGPDGNILWKNGKTYDFRGMFCFQKKVLEEANYDLLGFMMFAASRSHRINRNAAQISGDGVNNPLGWLRADCFTKLKTPAVGDPAAPSFTHVDYRRFVGSAPVEYGKVVATMHQNLFGYLAASVDSTGRFIFGDNLMGFSPDDVVDRIRISNCLPDPTVGNTLGSAAAPFVAGAFLLAAGNWELAYKSVSRKPMSMEQFIGGSTKWCVKYQFGAEDGGFVACCPAARILTVG